MSYLIDKINVIIVLSSLKIINNAKDAINLNLYIIKEI